MVDTCTNMYKIHVHTTYPCTEYRAHMYTHAQTRTCKNVHTHRLFPHSHRSYTCASHARMVCHTHPYTCTNMWPPYTTHVMCTHTYTQVQAHRTQAHAGVPLYTTQTLIHRYPQTWAPAHADIHHTCTVTQCTHVPIHVYIHMHTCVCTHVLMQYTCDALHHVILHTRTQITHTQHTY
jgi:hypothetical protein